MSNRPSLNAIKLLDNARVASPDRPEGTFSCPAPNGRAVVTWNRTTRTYDVGTAARSIAKGRRAVVLPVLERILAGDIC
jgi:hypothetical protein